jgi:maltose alpha-D-glucosyltransferase / alpha-amylase
MEMWQEYAPDVRMKLNLGIRRRLAPLLENDMRKITLMNALLFTLPGAPIIYYGDEIGMGDNIWLPDRNGVRTPMQWDSSRHGGFSTAELTYEPVISDEEYGYQKVNVAAQINDPNSILNITRKLMMVRAANPVLTLGSFMMREDVENTAIFAYQRILEEQAVWVVANLSGMEQVVALPDAGSATDLLTGTQHQLSNLTLAPYECLWLKVG